MVVESEHIPNWNFLKASSKVSSLLHAISENIRKFFGLFGLLIALIALLPIVILVVTVSVTLYKKMAKDISKIKLTFIAKISNFTFERVIEEEREISKLKSNLEKMVQKTESDKDVFILKSYYKNSKAILEDLKEIEIALKSRYRLKSSDFFETENDFLAYQKAMSELSDVWGYESTIEEKNVAFDIKKKNDSSK